MEAYCDKLWTDPVIDSGKSNIAFFIPFWQMESDKSASIHYDYSIMKFTMSLHMVTRTVVSLA